MLNTRIRAFAAGSPAQVLFAGFAAVILLFTGLLSLPAATASGERAPFIDALFTATSAVCVTGLTTVDTGTFWSPLGQVIILLGIKLGGLGIMTAAALLVMWVTHRLGLAPRLLVASEARAAGLGDVRLLLRTVVIVSTATETLIALSLVGQLYAFYGSWPTAIGHAMFFGVSAFNNAGFVPDPGSFAMFADTALVQFPLACGVFIGGLGFPVYLNLLRQWRNRRWTLHTKLTLSMMVALTVLSTLLVTIFEWSNPQTLGDGAPGSRFGQALFMSINQRSAGFALVNHDELRPQTWLWEDIMMFIGGGSGGTAGGIRVTTLAVLILAIWAEARGRRDVEVFRKRIGTEVVRLAVAVTLVSLFLVLVGTLVILAQTSATTEPLALDRILFEVVSAFATCGLSTGITAALPGSSKVTLVALMFLGRLGSLALVTALSLNRERRVIRFPAERPIVG